MAITVINKPLGHKLGTTQQTGQIIDDGTGDVLVYTGDAHGMTDGDYVLIESNFDSYNGYKYVDSISYDSFKIKDSEASDHVEFVQAADITFYISILNHGFQCVHLPIVYELESDLWPNNSTESANTVSSQSDSNGYTKINLTGALSDPIAYAKIELVGDGELAGVYQIISVSSSSSVVIDLIYDAGNSFSGYLVVKYYDNYAINVNVYAGLTSDHRWESMKPFELAATLKFVPDSDGRTKFSIAELLRAYINNRNNLTLDTLPNNLDFIVGFYIEYFESYDVSDGEEITTFEGTATQDDFTGYAVNAKLEFKSETGSYLSNYIDSGSIYARWLTHFESPIIMVGQFFDISFLNQHNGFDILIRKGGADYLTIENPGAGIIRVPLEAESGEEEICLSAFVTSSGSSSLSMEGFENRGLDPDTWVTGASPSITFTSIFGGTSDELCGDINLPPGDYIFTLLNNDQLIGSITLLLRDSSFNLIDSANDTAVNPGVTINFPVTVTEDTSIISLRVSSFTNSTNSFSNLAYTMDGVYQVTEEICLTVIEECENTFSEDEARLTEDDILRLLE